MLLIMSKQIVYYLIATSFGFCNFKMKFNAFENRNIISSSPNELRRKNKKIQEYV